jgi:hypothetical protein
MMNRARRLHHWLLHRLRLEPCMNYTEWRDDVLWHYVCCTICGQRVLEFPADLRVADTRPMGER